MELDIPKEVQDKYDALWKERKKDPDNEEENHFHLDVKQRFENRRLSESCGNSDSRNSLNLICFVLFCLHFMECTLCQEYRLVEQIY